MMAAGNLRDFQFYKTANNNNNKLKGHVIIVLMVSEANLSCEGVGVSVGGMRPSGIHNFPLLAIIDPLPVPLAPLPKCKGQV